MQAYRDQYATIFNNGRNVVVLAISADADTTLASWFRELETPILAVSDADGNVSKAYQARPEGRSTNQRHAYVIDPNGRIAYKAIPFREMVQDAYDELGAVVDRLNPPGAPGPG
jgi:peroxiredoxin